MTDPFRAPSTPATTAGSQRVDDRIPRDHKKRYLLPDPTTGEVVPWRRVSTLKKALANEYGLNKWKLRQVARGVAMRPDLATLAASVADPKTEQGKDTLSSVAEQAQDAAGSRSGANLGTALHTATERLDRGESLGSINLPAPYNFDLAVYDRFKRANPELLQTNPNHVERVLVVPELQVAGTLDRLYGRKVGDLKTGQDANEYGQLELAIQLACYSHAAYWYNLDTETYEPVPEIDQREALMVHLPAGGRGRIDVYRVDIAAGWIAAQVAHQVLAMQSQQSRLVAPYENVTRVPLDDLTAAAARHHGHPGNAAQHFGAAVSQVTMPPTLAATPQQSVAQRIDAAFPLGHPAEHAALPAGCCGGWRGPNGELQRCDPCPTPGVQRGVGEALEAQRVEIERQALAAAVHDEHARTISNGAAAGIPEPVARAILAARSQAELVQLYAQGTAAGMWNDTMTELGHCVTAAYITPCPVTTQPHGETLACGCGYRRPDALPSP